MKKVFSKVMILFLFLSFTLSAQSIQWQNLDTVKAKRFDTGKMWTFDYPPTEYWKEAYGFTPSQEWLDKARLASIRFATWCSSSFVSEDGLVMTNHHCVDQVLESFQKPGEDIAKNGFFAATLADERKMPSVFVDQLIKIEDVTKSIIDAVNAANTPEEKATAKAAKSKELTEKYKAENPGLKCQLVQLYNGGKYSMYMYKTYKDVRAVYMNERDLGLYGGDFDNFTYPRYDADFAFVRVYDENGKPLKTKNFFKMSETGPQAGEPLFVTGNPGSTFRLKTVAQLEYFRDISYANIVASLKGQVKVLFELAALYPEKADSYNNQAFFVGNSAKSLGGALDGLRDPEFIARKKDFEKKFKEAVFANPELKAKYGHLWDAIAGTRNEMRKFALEMSGYGVRASQYFTIAKQIYNLAKKGPMPVGEELDKEIKKMFPEDFDKVMQEKLLKLHVDLVEMNLGMDNDLVKKIFDGKKGDEAAKYLLANSLVTTKEGVLKLAKEGSESILKSNDPFITFVKETADKLTDMQKKSVEINKTEKAFEEELGQAFLAVFGTSIPPDATFTLRIADGVMKSYEYNGTKAPEFTTFYGMYDRFYSHRQKYPWALPERWAKPSKELDMSAPYNFVSTNDIIGGNSGSPIINKNLEVVGAVFDGNMESLPGNFIFDTTANRTVSVASTGIFQILYNITHAERIAKELKAGKIVD
jgi:hypothetical protein